MIYTIEDYRQAFKIDGRRVHYHTLMKRVHDGNLPSNHRVHRLNSHQFIIEVKERDDVDRYFLACTEYHDREAKGLPMPLEYVATLTVKYDISLTKLMKFLGI
jgi:hypothetical protein